MDKTTKKCLLTLCDKLLEVVAVLPMQVSPSEIEGVRTEVLKCKISNRKPKDELPPVDRDKLKEVMAYFREQWGGNNVPNFNSVYYPRNIRPAKEALLLANCDAEKVKRVIDYVKQDMNNKNIPWTMQTVVKMYKHVEAKIGDGIWL